MLEAWLGEGAFHDDRLIELAFRDVHPCESRITAASPMIGRAILSSGGHT